LRNALYKFSTYLHLLYAIEIYENTNHCHLSKLEKLNNKILQILQNMSIRTNNIELYKYYDTLPLPLLHNWTLRVPWHCHNTDYHITRDNMGQEPPPLSLDVPEEHPIQLSDDFAVVPYIDEHTGDIILSPTEKSAKYFYFCKGFIITLIPYQTCL